MKKITDFVAIDFETANAKRTSACSIGIAIFEDLKLVSTSHYLIKPYPSDFDPFNVSIHGITEDDVADAPTFDELWNDIAPLIEGKLVVAHNASFDMSVLRRTLEFYHVPLPELRFLCTYRLTERVYPQMDSHRLNTISRLLKIELNHHNAESDAIACGEILCHILSENNISTSAEFEEKFNVTFGYMNPLDYVPSRKLTLAEDGKPVKAKRASEYVANADANTIDPDFYGKYFVFTGTLSSMQRQTAYGIVSRGGGFPQDAITKKTNYLVVGLQDYRKLNGGMSTKMKKAQECRSKGQDIKIIIEDEFISMIDDHLYETI